MTEVTGCGTGSQEQDGQEVAAGEMMLAHMLEKEGRAKTERKRKTKTFGPWAKNREEEEEGGMERGRRDEGSVLSSSGRAAALLACWAVSKTRV